MEGAAAAALFNHFPKVVEDLIAVRQFTPVRLGGTSLQLCLKLL